jgi:hypothetical protein
MRKLTCSVLLKMDQLQDVAALILASNQNLGKERIWVPNHRTMLKRSRTRMNRTQRS